MGEIELYQELERKLRQLDVCIKQLRQTGSEFAEAERAYQIAKRDTCLRLKAEGMAVGMVSMVCKGEPEVATKLYDRIAKEAIYRANQEAVMSLKLQIRVIDNQITREYGNPNVGKG